MTARIDIDRVLLSLVSELAAVDDLSAKLDYERDILMSGRHRYVDQATAAVAEAIATLEGVSKWRAAVLGDASVALGLRRRATLREIAESVPSADDRRCLLVLRRELRTTLTNMCQVADDNKQMLARGLAATADALSLLGAPPSYDASGRSVQGIRRPLLLDARM